MNYVAAYNNLRLNIIKIVYSPPHIVPTSKDLVKLLPKHSDSQSTFVIKTLLALPIEVHQPGPSEFNLLILEKKRNSVFLRR